MSALLEEAGRQGVKPPAPATLRRYGLTAPEWLEHLARQGWKCPVCKKGGARVLWNTDHDHVPRWKYMEPGERKRYVRGILCAYCNRRRVNSRMSAAEAQRIATYLSEYETRRDA